MDHGFLGKKRLSFISGIALLAILMVGVQVGLILFRGQGACLNEGCRVVESLTTIPPLYFNVIGLGYFLLVFLTARFSRVMEDAQALLGILLLAGMAVEGVLFSYQQFVAKVFCAYCLTVLGFVLILNAGAGVRQLFTGAAMGLGIYGAFAALSYGPGVILGRSGGLDKGTIAVIGTQEKPVQKHYLFFSRNCPHCGIVIAKLPEYSMCEIRLNPIDAIKGPLPVPAERKAGYLPEINRIFFTVLQLETVPLLLVSGKDESKIIMGEKKIVSYLDQECLPSDMSLPEEAPNLEGATSSLPLGEDILGECDIREECRE